MRGVGLVELCVSLAVLGVLAAAGWPQLGAMVRREAVEQQSLAWRSALRLARNEAVRLGETVTLCARDTTVGEHHHQCATASSEWSGGWLVFIDRGERGALGADDRVLRVHQLTGPPVRIQASTPRVSFQPTGISFNAASNIRFEPAAQAPGSPLALLLCVNKAGRVRVSASSQACA